MFRKRIVVLFAFVSAVIMAVFFPLLNCNQPVNPAYHSFLTSDEFQKLPRKQQISKCATCHKQVFENEIKGPHANAYKSLLEHKNFVNSDKYDCDFYTKVVNKSFEDCMGCHTPQNMYETLLKDSLNQPLSLIDRLLKEAHPRPLTRTNAADKATSIDCMSCHYDGQKMLSLKHINTAEDSNVSKQTLPVIVANNLNCYLCHFDAVRNFDPEIAIKRTGTARCVNCHQEYDASKKGTHYFFWQHDSIDKHNPKPSLLLDDFHFALSGDKKSATITWQNTIMPHKISPGPELVLFCDVLSKDSTILGSTTIRINKKKAFDKEMYSALGNRNHRGIEGQDVPLDGNTIDYKIPLKNSAKVAFYKITMVHKSQYWFPDSLGTMGIVRTYPLNN